MPVMTGIAIIGTGVYTPPHSISNEELVQSYNTYVERFNRQHDNEIKAGLVAALEPSSVEFILKASGIKSRFVIDKKGILDPDIMMPQLPERANDELSIMAEMGLKAARAALEQAGRTPADIDGVIVACSGHQRPYPAIAIEIQEALGINGFGFDMNVACSSATFGIQAAAGLIESAGARAVLVIGPEICSGQLNFRNRDSHFIFGDVATAVLVERNDEAGFQIVNSRLKTKFSNNIRSNFGFLNRTAPKGIGAEDRLFMQEGRKVFKEVVPMVADFIVEHMNDNNITVDHIRRLWLHQANIHMNDLIGRKVLGKEPEAGQAPIILDQYANTASAGSIIAFHKYRDDIKTGELGIICSFGAGYSIGSVIVRKI